MFNRNRSLGISSRSSSSARRTQVSKESYIIRVGAVTLAFLLMVVPIASGVQITEVMYDLPGSDKGLEWIEVYNPDNSTVDLTGWRLYEQDSKHKLKLVQGNMTLQPNECAVIVDKPDTWLEAHASYTGTVIDSTFSLKNSKKGEYIAIMNQSFDIQCNVSYTPELGANGNGFSLLLNATSGLLYEGTVEGGTPGEVEVITSETIEPEGETPDE